VVGASIAIVDLGFIVARFSSGALLEWRASRVARFAIGGKPVTGLSTAFDAALMLCGGGLLTVALRYYRALARPFSDKTFTGQRR